ncbi:MAG: hypothetical protein IJ604_04120 [Prevotella sp.]|nr:hypothetical protein [Prevotella sp.]
MSQNKLRNGLFSMVMLLFGVLPAMATSTYYYKATVTAKLTDGTTGGGKVYVTATTGDTPEYTATGKTITGYDKKIGNAGFSTFYYYASADDGYIFSHWTDGSWNNSTHAENSTDGVSYFNTNRSYTSENERNPTTFQTFAIFEKQTGIIKVQTSDASKGTVSISKIANVMGDEVELRATGDAQNGIRFLGWKKNNTGDYVSTDNPYTLTASAETAGTYYAYFSEPAEMVYCRIQNNKTKRFLSIYGGSDKRAPSHTRSYKDYSGSDGFIFNDCLKLISADQAQGNPTTVFKLQGSATGQGTSVGVNLTAQGVSYLNYVDNNNNYDLMIETNSSGVSRIFTPFTLDPRISKMNSYFCDEGGDWLVMKTTDGLDDDVIKSSEWTVYILDENTVDGAFGANAKSKYTKDGMYYTTMYTDFPYQLLDGVRAYYLHTTEDAYDKENNMVHFQEIESGKVPARMPVVLECQEVQNENGETIGVKNRLLPLTENVPQILQNEEDNYLKGYISLDGATEENDKKHMYVLSSKGGELGFYHSTSAAMTANKAFLYVPDLPDDVAETAKSTTFSFKPKAASSENEPTGIALSDEYATSEDSPIYHISGQKVDHRRKNALPKGIYISKGKKFIVK